MSSNLPLVRRSRRVLPWLGGGGLKLEINIPSQRIRAKWKGGLINEGGVILSEYGTTVHRFVYLQCNTASVMSPLNTKKYNIGELHFRIHLLKYDAMSSKNISAATLPHPCRKF